MTEGCFEARKWGWRQTKEGIVVSFLVHPNDINAALAIAPLGTIYAIGFREMPEGDQSTGPQTAPLPAVETPEAGAKVADKARRKFSEMSRSQQAGMLCQDVRFRDWLDVDTHDEAAEVVRKRCGVESRAHLDNWREFPIAAGKWDMLVTAYHAETGQMAEDRS